MTHITDQLAALRKRIAAAALSCGREPGSVSILAVSKRQGAAAVRELVSAGIADFAENYVQEALGKMAEIPDARWHFIGQVQSNKTRTIAERFDWVETITREKIARRLSAQRPYHGAPLNVCIQVRLQEHDSRPGVAPTGVPALASAIADMPGLRLRGLLGMPTPDCARGETAQAFARLARLYRELADTGLALDTLSMGMSRDLEIAIEHGSTQVRVGTALFGPRPE